MLMGEAQPAKVLRQRPSRAEHIVRDEDPPDFCTFPQCSFCRARCQGRRLAVECLRIARRTAGLAGCGLKLRQGNERNFQQANLPPVAPGNPVGANMENVKLKRFLALAAIITLINGVSYTLVPGALFPITACSPRLPRCLASGCLVPRC